MLGKSLVEAGVDVRILDIDERFKDQAGFTRFDISAPHWLGEEFDVVLCDPPFFNVSLRQIAAALQLVSRHLFTQPLLVSYLQRRTAAVLRTFAPFQLLPTGVLPGYESVQDSPRNRIEFFSNLPASDVERLRTS